MLSQKVAEGADMLLQSAISHERAVSRKGFRPRQRNERATLVYMPGNELARLDRRAGPGRGRYAASFDLWLREPISIAEMLVRVVKGRNAIKIQ